MKKKPTVLMILDGYGLNENCDHNAVCEGKTPVMDQLMSQCPFVKGNASGMAVGLPEGQMGNSEVGHLNMGAGRIVYQELTRITKSIADGDFFQVPAVAVNLADDPFAGKFYEIRVVGSMDGKLKITVIFFHFLSGKT